MPPAARSLWSDTMPAAEVASGEPLDGSLDADVAIVGAGLTGLWTAWYLASAEPSMRIVVLEADTIGFGASGRNGGWCSAMLPMSHDRIARHHGWAAAIRMQRAMHENLDTIEDFVTAGADDGPAIFHRGGTIDLARTAPQRTRLLEDVESYQRLGFDDHDYRWLEPDEASAWCRASGTLGALVSPHCATVHPLRLTHLIARRAIGRGVRVLEHTRARRIEPGCVTTDRGTVRATTVLTATEGYTPRLPGRRRSVLPIYSMMIATEPLPDEVWNEIGLDGRPTFADARHLVIYGQRTADRRLAFGGRGAPYHFGSRIEPEFDTDERVRELLVHSLHDLFPALADASITNHWGGVLATPRDWTCSVRFDRRTGTGTAGGYVGDGVATAHLAGRTLALLVLDQHDDDLVRLPWVGHRSRNWEPEPLRWLGVNAGRVAAARSDAAERNRGTESRFWTSVMRFLLRR
ncbi:MAG: NAD(P)/FAD-dependent oxidoreductase [Ilumatobacteraceae bacterium]